MKAKVLINLIVAITAVRTAAEVRFEHLNQVTRLNIAETFLGFVKSDGCHPSLLTPRSEGMFYFVWDPPFCTESDFKDWRGRGYFPTSVAWDGFRALGAEQPIWLDEQGGKGEELKSPTRLLNDCRKGLYLPIISLGDRPLFAFLAKGLQSSTEAKSGYAYIPNLTFYIGGIEKTKEFKNRLSSSQRSIVELRNRINKRCEAVSPPVTLTRREATEIVYLTALCRGKVKTLAEFNAAFVPKDERFLVTLTAAECETEIGQMLYKLVRKRRLIPKMEGEK